MNTLSFPVLNTRNALFSLVKATSYAFVDWQIDLLNEHTDLNAGVVIVRPIQSDFPPSLNTQDGLYTTIIRGLNGQGASESRLIRSVNREIDVYGQYDAFPKLAHYPDMRCFLEHHRSGY